MNELDGTNPNVHYQPEELHHHEQDQDIVHHQQQQDDQHHHGQPGQEVAHAQHEHEMHHQQDVHERQQQEQQQQEQEQQQQQVEQHQPPPPPQPAPAPVTSSRKQRMTTKQQNALKEEVLTLKFNNIVMSRQLLIARTRLEYALDCLQCAKEGRPYQKLYALAVDERKFIKEALPPREPLAQPVIERREQPRQQAFTKIVETKRGERQRPSKYSTRPKDEMAVIGAAADSIINGSATLREAKEALRDMGVANFETSLSNKMYNHPNKRRYLEIRKKNRIDLKDEGARKDMHRKDRKKRTLDLDPRMGMAKQHKVEMGDMDPHHHQPMDDQHQHHMESHDHQIQYQYQPQHMIIQQHQQMHHPQSQQGSMHNRIIL